MKAKHLTSLIDLTSEDVDEIFEWSERLKERVAFGIHEYALEGKFVGLIFEKASMRTRVSFEVAIKQLGGSTLYMDQGNIGLGTREAIKDVGKVLSRYVHGLVIRTFKQEKVTQLAAHSSVPVINGLSDYYHPCQALADLFTVRQKFGGFDGVRIVFVGDGNNVARSLTLGCKKLGIPLAIASPEGYALDEGFMQLLDGSEGRSGFELRQLHDPIEAVKGSNVIYTDTWTSMGQEEEAQRRREAFARFQVNQKLLAAASPGAVVMHCLPAHRGEEITDDVMDSPASIVYDQAENRLHVQRAVLRLLMGPPVNGQ